MINIPNIPRVIIQCIFEEFCSNGNLNIVRFLVNLRIVNLDYDNYRAIGWSVLYGSLEIVEFLVNSSKSNVKDYIPGLIRLAARRGRLNMLKFLINLPEAYIDNNVIESAALNDHFEAVRFLLTVPIARKYYE